MRGLHGKRVLVTGGASGIGAATAGRFLEEGAAVVVLDRDTEGRRKIQAELPELAGTVDADVSNLAQVTAAFDDACKIMGGVDVLINNAGISIRHNFLDITPAEWDTLQPEIRVWEPRAALVGENLHEEIARRADTRFLVLEVGDGQAQNVAGALRSLGYLDVTISRDLAGKKRVVEGRRR